MIQIKRVYEPPAKTDGHRILIDRLWPRGIKKADLPFDTWEKDLAPSPALRKAFAHKPENFATFRAAYRAELRKPPSQEKLRALAQLAKKDTVTLLYAARDPQINHAVVLLSALNHLAS